jgi:hypothetical protein
LQTEHEFVIAATSAIELASMMLVEESGSGDAQLCSMLIPGHLTDREAGLILLLSSGSALGAQSRKRPRLDSQTISLNCRHQNLSVNNIINPPKDLLQGIMSSLLFKEKAALFSVNKAWKRVVQKVDIVDLTRREIGPKMNEALLFAAREICQRLKGYLFVPLMT